MDLGLQNVRAKHYNMICVARGVHMISPLTTAARIENSGGRPVDLGLQGEGIQVVQIRMICVARCVDRISPLTVDARIGNSGNPPVDFGLQQVRIQDV